MTDYFPHIPKPAPKPPPPPATNVVRRPKHLLWSKWNRILEKVLAMGEQGAYQIRPPLRQSQISSLRSVAKYRLLALRIRQEPRNRPTRTLVWLKGPRAGYDRKIKGMTATEDPAPSTQEGPAKI